MPQLLSRTTALSFTSHTPPLIIKKMSLESESKTINVKILNFSSNFQNLILYIIIYDTLKFSRLTDRLPTTDHEFIHSTI